MRRTVWDEVQEILDEADALVRRADRREKSKKLSKDDSASTKQRETQMHQANEAEVERLCREVEQEFGKKRGRAKATTGERMEAHNLPAAITDVNLNRTTPAGVSAYRHVPGDADETVIRLDHDLKVAEVWTANRRIVSLMKRAGATPLDRQILGQWWRVQ